MWMLRKLQAVVLQYSSLNDWIRLLLTSECCGLPRGECGNGFNYKQKLGSILSPRHEARILRLIILCLIMTYENIILTGRWFKCACAVIWIWIHVCNYTHVSICVWAMNGLCRFLESTLETHAQPGDDCSLLIYCQYNVIRINLMVSLFIS